MFLRVVDSLMGGYSSLSILPFHEVIIFTIPGDTGSRIRLSRIWRLDYYLAFSNYYNWNSIRLISEINSNLSRSLRNRDVNNDCCLLLSFFIRIYNFNFRATARMEIFIRWKTFIYIYIKIREKGSIYTFYVPVSFEI